MIRIGIKHQPSRFGRYQEVHNTVISQFQARSFVGPETLVFDPAAYGILLKGEIGCRGNIVVNVDKFIEILDGSGETAIVQTRWYSYNVFVRGYYNIFRYDNQDADYLRQGHLDEHHKHHFDWRIGRELHGSPEWIGADKWPTLGNVLEEVEDWYWTHQAELPNPDSYPSVS